MIIDVTAELDGVEFSPGNTYEEILQNVRTICTTPKGTVPLDRDFGLDQTLLDAPIAVAKARYTSEIISVVQRYEPRVKVTRVMYDGDGADGKLNAKVQVKIADGLEEIA